MANRGSGLFFDGYNAPFLCIFRETAPHAFQLDLFFNNVSKPNAPVFDRLGRY